MTEPTMTCDLARDLAGGYVLGALERSEETAVRDHLATCPEPHPEFAALGEVVPSILALADMVRVEPPASLGARIMAAAAADLAANPRVAAGASVSGQGPVPLAPAPMSAAATASVVVPAPASAAAASSDRAAVSPAIPFPTAEERADRAERAGGASRTRASRFDWALRIAAVIAIVAVGGWGLNLQRQLDGAHRFESAVAAVVQTAAQPGAKTIVLAAASGGSASGIGAVAGDGSVVLAMHQLAATNGSQVYEAWVIVGHDAPLAVGGFTVDGTGTASYTTRPATTPAGATIALTLEPNAGDTAPQGPVVSAGQAIAPPGQTN